MWILLLENREISSVERNNFHDAESLIFKDPNLLFEGRFRNQGQARKRFALKAKSIASGIKGSRVSFEIRLSMGLPVLHRKGLLVLLFASPDNSALRRRAKGNKYSIIEGDTYTHPLLTYFLSLSLSLNLNLIKKKKTKRHANDSKINFSPTSVLVFSSCNAKETTK